MMALCKKTFSLQHVYKALNFRVGYGILQ